MTRIVLCDDNRVFLEKLRDEIQRILKNHREVCKIYMFESAEEMGAERIEQTDIFFLDIDFENRQYTGMDIARKIRTANTRGLIIFVTNFVQYAPEGYEVQAFRYLLKSDVHVKLEYCLLQAIAKLAAESETISLTAAGEAIVLPIRDILYLEAQAHNVVVHVYPTNGEGSREYRFYTPLSAIEQQLENRGFLRIQKSYLVNIRRVVKYQCTGVQLDTGQVLNASQKMYSVQKKKYLLWKGSNK